MLHSGSSIICSCCQKTVLLMASIHKSNLKQTSNKCSSEEDWADASPKDKSSAAHLRHGEGELVIKNWERTRKSIRKPTGSPALRRQPTTVSSSSAVFPSVPLHRLRESHTSDRNNREIYSRLVLTDGSRRQCAQISTTTRVTPVHSKGENIVPVRAVGAYIHVVSSFVTILPSVLIISET